MISAKAQAHQLVWPLQGGGIKVQLQEFKVTEKQHLGGIYMCQPRCV